MLAANRFQSAFSRPLARPSTIPSHVRAFSSASSSSAANNSASASIRTVGVIGAGQMGTGIALVAAVQAKRRVIIMDKDAKQLDSSMKFAKKLLEKDISKSKITSADADAALARVSVTTDLAEFGRGTGVDFVIEAVSENVDLKKKIFSELGQVTRPDVILATNTSSISITKFQHNSVTNKPDKVGACLHCMYWLCWRKT